MTVVDVNTGKFVGSGGNLEETVTKNNLEAAEEIVRQLRLRDIGGIIVIDFIDMVLETNRDLVVRRLLECLGRDRTKHQVAEVTSLGLVQMTRKRVGSGLIEVFSEQCEHCGGRGIVVHTEPIDRSGGTGGGSGDQRQRPLRARPPRHDHGAHRPAAAGRRPAARTAHRRRRPAAVRPDRGPDRRRRPRRGPAPRRGRRARRRPRRRRRDGRRAAAVAQTSFDATTDADAPSRPARRAGRARRAVADSAPVADVAPRAVPVADAPTPWPRPSPAAAPVAVEPRPTSPQPRAGRSRPPRGRRKRGRVVAPAGPPRATASEDGGSATAPSRPRCPPR